MLWLLMVGIQCISAHYLSSTHARFFNFLCPCKDIPLRFDDGVLMSSLRGLYQLDFEILDEIDDEAVALLVQVLGANVCQLLLRGHVVDGDISFLD